MKILWHPNMQHFAILLGFRSPRAQDVIHNGLDHHRSRQIIHTLVLALGKELLQSYVQHVGTDNVTVDNYIDRFERDVTSPNYKFAWRVCFTYLLAFQLYTESLRKNNHRHMMAACAAFALLFYGRNLLRYRELHLRDMMDRVQCPPTLHRDIHANESFSFTGLHNRGQWVDFLHEVNKKVKSLLPPGPVTEAKWRRVCRKADQLSEIKLKCVSAAGLSTNSGWKGRQSIMIAQK